jgi:protein-S-isoprenylcysteine O-methyltransferase Ste14
VTTAALSLFAVYLGVGFLLRGWLQWRRTGDTGFRGISGRAGSPEWWGGALFVLALVAGVLGPVTAVAGVPPLSWLTDPRVQWTGVALAAVGIVGTLLTQLSMGASWRIGVDATETTALVTNGAFAHVRNPIFTAMAVTAAGLALMVPNAVALAGLVLLLVALQIQVRVVEEPYLRVTHGEDYRRYAARTGRFLPGIGRVRSDRRDAEVGATCGSRRRG